MKKPLLIALMIMLVLPVHAQLRSRKIDSLSHLLPDKKAILHYYPASDTVQALINLFYKKQNNALSAIPTPIIIVPFWLNVLNGNISAKDYQLDEELHLELAITGIAFYCTYLLFSAIDKQIRYDKYHLILALEYFRETRKIHPSIRRVFHRKWKHGELLKHQYIGYDLP